MVAGCAGGGAAPVVPTVELARLNGWYQGRRVPVSSVFTCREQPRIVWFRVEDGGIEMRSARHRRSAVGAAIMGGRIAADGQIVLRGISTDTMAAGRIDGETLTASDLPGEAVVRDGQSVCLHRYEATRQEGLRN